MNVRTTAITRIRVITGCILLIALLLITRLYYLQFVQHEYYSERANRQYTYTVQQLFDRGTIYFTTKTGEMVSAAAIQSGYVLAVDPTRVIDPEATYTAVNDIFPLVKEDFIAAATRDNRTYVEVDTEVPTSMAEPITELGLSGVLLYRNQWRFYPGDTLASRIIGFIGFSAEEENALVGRYGLERYYEEVLERSNDEVSVNFFAEIFSGLGEVIFDGTSTRTGDLTTTIEPTVARMLDQTLADVQAEWGSTNTGGIIMDPETGAIYAMNVAPTFNINDRSSNTIADFRNPLVEDVYEMGSIIKPLTVAAGLDSQAITPNTTYYDAGSLELDTFTIRNYDGRGRGTVDMQEVLNQSLNTGVSFVVDEMGKSTFREYFKALKLGSETGIDLPNEVFGLIGNLDSPRDVEYATASFGQGIALTPIATVRALATLGNGGHLVTPHIVQSVQYQDGTSKEVMFPAGDQVFSEETSTTISRMLTTVVDEALGGGDVALPNHSIAAKTGTAQIADQQDGGYYDDRFLHSFFGYFPSYDPEFLVFLYTLEPQGARYASETLTDPFMDISKFLINYYNVPPDR